MDISGRPRVTVLQLLNIHLMASLMYDVIIVYILDIYIV